METQSACGLRPLQCFGFSRVMSSKISRRRQRAVRCREWPGCCLPSRGSVALGGGLGWKQGTGSVQCGLRSRNQQLDRELPWGPECTLGGYERVRGHGTARV